MEYSACLVPGKFRVLLGDSKVRSLLGASGVRTFPSDTQIVWQKRHKNLVGESEAHKFLWVTALCFISFHRLHWLRRCTQDRQCK